MEKGQFQILYPSDSLQILQRQQTSWSAGRNATVSEHFACKDQKILQKVTAADSSIFRNNLWCVTHILLHVKDTNRAVANSTLQSPQILHRLTMMFPPSILRVKKAPDSFIRGHLRLGAHFEIKTGCDAVTTQSNLEFHFYTVRGPRTTSRKFFQAAKTITKVQRDERIQEKMH